MKIALLIVVLFIALTMVSTAHADMFVGVQMSKLRPVIGSNNMQAAININPVRTNFAPFQLSANVATNLPQPSFQPTQFSINAAANLPKISFQPTQLLGGISANINANLPKPNFQPMQLSANVAANLPQPSFQQTQLLGGIDANINLPKPTFLPSQYGSVDVEYHGLTPKFSESQFSVEASANIQGPPMQEGEIPGIVMQTNFQPNYGQGRLYFNANIPLKQLPEGYYPPTTGIALKSIPVACPSDCQQPCA
ncbi:MAG: hypothetical protein NT120_04655 [Candidatus Aenigmarchaeota archaeon]|nr:hypothetical protein [Candidatus Aenigmarchaeota archaeon]